LDLSEHYEIIIFTTSLEPYAREVTKNIKGIDHMLFRQHAVRVKHGFVKDLSRLGRDLKKVIILDDLSSNFKLQK
jgi:CTD small phosphatase-like protein 2